MYCSMPYKYAIAMVDEVVLTLVFSDEGLAMA